MITAAVQTFGQGFDQGVVLGLVAGAMAGALAMAIWVARPTKTRHWADDDDAPSIIKPASGTVHVDNVIDPVNYLTGHLILPSELAAMKQRIDAEAASRAHSGVFDAEAEGYVS